MFKDRGISMFINPSYVDVYMYEACVLTDSTHLTSNRWQNLTYRKGNPKAHGQAT